MILKHTVLASAVAEVTSAEVLSFDVFDTILLRRPIGERERLLRAARKIELRSGGRVDAKAYYVMRRQAQRLGYRTVDVAGGTGDVRFNDMLSRVVALLGLPADIATLCRDAELEVENTSLRLNQTLAEDMRTAKAAGKRIIAVSDTAWSSEDLAALIEPRLGKGIIDRFYSSADEGLTKRAGGLFARVLAEEQRQASAFLHIGDDRLADVDQAHRAGLHAFLAKPAQTHRLTRRTRYLSLAMREFVQTRHRMRQRSTLDFTSRADIGNRVFGPIAAELCSRLWLYLSYQPAGDTAALFCARGGLAIGAMLERFLARTKLPLEVLRAQFMISRIAALRVAFVCDGPSAQLEMAREFKGQTCGQAGRALSGLPCGDDPAWTAAFEYKRFRGLLLKTAHGQRAMAEIVVQAGYSEQHLHQASGGAKHVVLCDTGLYGSTGRFLKEGMPALAIQSLLAARCDYKHLGRDHFGYTTGLLTESNGYAPWDVRSSILRYWQLFEQFCESDLASVRSYQTGPDGKVVSNLEVPGWEDQLVPAEDSILSGIMAYLDQLQPGHLGTLPNKAEEAWCTLHNAILNPRPEHIELLGIHNRSVDFGDDKLIPVITALDPARTLGEKMRSVQTSLWREGAITSQFPNFRFLLLPAMNGLYGLRALKRRTSEMAEHSGRTRSVRGLVGSAARRMGFQLGSPLPGERV
jgi:FMN phosphatase YigB (HAD superfamily)